MDNASLDQSILRTVTYFSLFDFPLTSFEIWKWLQLSPKQRAPAKSVSFSAVSDRLYSSLRLKRNLVQELGFFGLGNVAAQVTMRSERLHNAMRKYHKLGRVLRVLGRLPWIQGVAVCNSLAWLHTREGSDIDLFIITTPGRTWSARLVATLPLWLMGARPGEAAQDPICVSFFSAPSQFDFSQIKIADNDPYLANWCRSLVPVIDRTGWLNKFTAANSWLNDVLPNAWTPLRANRFRQATPRQLWWLPMSEKLARAMQVERFPQAIKSRMNRDTCVIVNDHMLKFHHNDARQKIAANLEAKLASFSL